MTCVIQVRLTGPRRWKANPMWELRSCGLPAYAPSKQSFIVTSIRCPDGVGWNNIIQYQKGYTVTVNYEAYSFNSSITIYILNIEQTIQSFISFFTLNVRLILSVIGILYNLIGKAREMSEYSLTLNSFLTIENKIS